MTSHQSTNASSTVTQSNEVAQKTLKYCQELLESDGITYADVCFIITMFSDYYGVQAGEISGTTKRVELTWELSQVALQRIETSRSFTWEHAYFATQTVYDSMVSEARGPYQDVTFREESCQYPPKRQDTACERSEVAEFHNELVDVVRNQDVATTSEEFSELHRDYQNLFERFYEKFMSQYHTNEYQLALEMTERIERYRESLSAYERTLACKTVLHWIELHIRTDMRS